jgi:hypothetical protein
MAKQKEVRWILHHQGAPDYWKVRDDISELLSTGWKVEAVVNLGDNCIHYIFTKTIKQIQEEAANGDV